MQALMIGLDRTETMIQTGLVGDTKDGRNMLAAMVINSSQLKHDFSLLTGYTIMTFFIPPASEVVHSLDSTAECPSCPHAGMRENQESTQNPSIHAPRRTSSPRRTQHPQSLRPQEVSQKVQELQCTIVAPSPSPDPHIDPHIQTRTEIYIIVTPQR